MRKLEAGECPKCHCSLIIYKSKNYKRYVKCEVCGISYPLPKRGSIMSSALECPKSGFPVLIIDKKDNPAYFWSDQPCFNCIQYDNCEIIKSLILEFKELKVYGY
jgi:ssDNA-binding Zn-finger/Zn-ribbon topoisomerase 1